MWTPRTDDGSRDGMAPQRTMARAFASAARLVKIQAKRRIPHENSEESVA